MQETISDRGHFRTAQASRYLQQLCKHFGHKVAARFDATSGVVDLPAGPLALTAEADQLVVTVTAADADGGEKTEKAEPTYATTDRFLDLFGLGALDDLPVPADLRFK